MPNRRVKIPSGEMLEKIPELKDFENKDSDTMIIIEALKELAKRYDDVYSPAIEDLQNDMDKTISLQNRAFNLTKLLSEKQKLFRLKDECVYVADTENMDFSLPGIISSYYKRHPWVFGLVIAGFIMFLPWLHNIAEIFIVGAVKRLLGIDIMAVWPSFFKGPGQ